MRRAALLVAALLGGCVMGPDPDPPDTRLRLDQPYAGAGDPRALPGEPEAQALAQWWRLLGDATLDALVEDALARNLDLDLARARIRQARAQRRITRADALPTLDATGIGQRQRISENVINIGPGAGGGMSGGATGGGTGGGGMMGFGLPGSEIDLFQASFDASWELDLFGEIRRRTQAADARVDAAVLSLADVRTSLVAELVRDYATLREQQTRLAVAGRNLAAARRTAGIVRERERGGIATEGDAARADAAVLALEALVPEYETRIRQSAYRVSVLTGREPGAWLPTLAPPRTLPAVPRTAATGLPSTLLRRRPDIRFAERNLAAATYEVGAALADLYPSFTLSVSAGTQADQIPELVEWASRFYRLGLNMLAPLFDGGRRRGTVELRRAEAEEQLVLYRQAVLTAFQDVEDALAAFARDQDRLATRDRETAARRRAVGVVQEQYRAGLVPLTDTLDAERDLYIAQDAAETARGAVAADWAALQKALGGGWTPPTETTR